MKAITIHQPWASLIAIGAKRFETRGWKTSYRGPIAIHSGKKINRDAVLMLASKYPKIWHKISPLPTGCIVAFAELTECYETKHDVIGGVVLLHTTQSRKFFETLDNEYEFGDFTSGRFAWEMANVRLLPEPIPAKGQQGLWNWNREE